MNLSRRLLSAALAAALLLAAGFLRAQPAAPQAPAPQPTTLVADLLDMTSTDTETRVICTGNVVLTGTNLRIACDRLEIIATRIGDADASIGTLESFKYLLATGNVRLNQDQREATCQRVEVFPLQETVVLTGSPVLIDRSTGMDLKGSKMTLLRGQRQVIVENVDVTAPELPDLGADAKAAPAAAQP